MYAEKDKLLVNFFGRQLSQWPLACNNFRALKTVQTKDLTIGGLTVRLQFNPARMISSAAKLDKDSIKARKCFLCEQNRPSEQILIPFEGRKSKKYHILVNPYPIFPEHFVIAATDHVPQSIARRYVDILDLSRTYSSRTFFYNGPHSGASAPDHHHFQACARGSMPLEQDVDRLLGEIAGESVKHHGPLRYVTSIQDADLFHYDKFVSGVFVLRAKTVKSSAKLFYRLLDCAPVHPGESEPRFNLFTFFEKGEYRSIVIFRTCHRSHHYFSEGDDHLTMSPGCADMGGLFIVPVEEDFKKLTQGLLSEMLDEITISKQEQDAVLHRLTRGQEQVSVGIMSSKEIVFEIISDGDGPRRARLCEGKIEYDGALYDELFFDASTLSTMFAEPSFVLHDVVIGKGFHWERRENQKFAGALKIIVEGDRLTAVNLVGVEDYLVSVISSEMKATASLEFLKTHTVISRSWLMGKIASRAKEHKVDVPRCMNSVPGLLTYLACCMDGANAEGDEHIKWYDTSDHKAYDVCADDHCQRYQGLTRAIGQNVRTAVDQTWGEVLTYEGEICDARFSKCCGGVSEEFGTCWEDEDHPYLKALPDTPNHDGEAEAFCSEASEEVLSQVLNSYDLETRDFYRWSVEYSVDELSDLVESRSGLGLGRIIDIQPLERGASGRIHRLKLVGSSRTVVVGKELEIRRILSTSHLKSSAFEIEIKDDRVRFEGRGWGHGVGLCQIGAAVMASRGYSYCEILEHYYPGEIKMLRIFPSLQLGIESKLPMLSLAASGLRCTQGQNDENDENDEYEK